VIYQTIIIMGFDGSPDVSIMPIMCPWCMPWCGLFGHVADCETDYGQWVGFCQPCV